MLGIHLNILAYTLGIDCISRSLLAVINPDGIRHRPITLAVYTSELRYDCIQNDETICHLGIDANSSRWNLC